METLASASLEALGVEQMAQGWPQNRSDNIPGKKHRKHQHLRDRHEKESPLRRAERSRKTVGSVS